MDIQYLLLLQNFREATSGLFNGFFLFMTDLGWSALPFLIVALVYWCIDKKTGNYLLMNVTLSGWLNGLVKLTACVYRPWIRSAAVKPLDSVFALATGYSFPSGHVANAVAVYGGLAVRERRNKVFRNMMIILIVLIAFSRNYVGVHTPQDVLVSAALGIFLLWLTAKAMKWVEEKDGRDLWFLLICVLLCVAQIVYIELKSYPMDYVDGKLLVDPEKMKLDSYGNMGMLIAFAAGWLLERRTVRFSTDVSIHRAIARFAVGSVLLLLLFYCFGAILTVCLPAKAARMCGNGFVMLFMVWLWPVIFTAWEKKHPEESVPAEKPAE